MIAAVVSALHVLALALGLPAVFLRSRALKGRLDAEGLRRLFAADSVWGLAALLWVATGLLRAFAGLEKGTAFYLASPLFWTKMALFVAVVALELWPMATFIRWRREQGRGSRAGHLASENVLPPEPRPAGTGGPDGLRGQLHGSRLRSAVTSRRCQSARFRS